MKLQWNKTVSPLLKNRFSMKVRIRISRRGRRPFISSLKGTLAIRAVMYTKPSTMAYPTRECTMNTATIIRIVRMIFMRGSSRWTKLSTG